MRTPKTDVEQLEEAVRWLRSHLHRLVIQRDALRGQLERATREVERVEGELASAERRLAGGARASGDEA